MKDGRNHEHYPDPTAAKAVRRCRTAREAELERMDALRPYVPTIEGYSEAEEQEVLMRWAAYTSHQYPALKWLYHCPNGGTRNPAEAVHLKRMGVKPGVPDLFLPFPSSGYHGLYIEMKSQRGTPTALQREWVEYLLSVGYAAEICRGFEAAQNVLLQYLKGEYK